MFFEVAQHGNTDTLEQFEREDIASDAPQMPHQEDFECGIGASGHDRLSWRNWRRGWRGESIGLLMGAWSDLFVSQDVEHESRELANKCVCVRFEL